MPKIKIKNEELTQEFAGKKCNDWINWYQRKMPCAVDDATEKIYEMVQKLKEAINLIDRDMVEKWSKDLILTKTFAGLCFQESILKKVATPKGVSYRLATPEEESTGVDGYIGEKPVSIKPLTYKTKNMCGE